MQVPIAACWPCSRDIFGAMGGCLTMLWMKTRYSRCCWMVCWNGPTLGMNVKKWSPQKDCVCLAAPSVGRKQIMDIWRYSNLRCSNPFPLKPLHIYTVTHISSWRVRGWIIFMIPSLESWWFFSPADEITVHTVHMKQPLFLITHWNSLLGQFSLSIFLLTPLVLDGFGRCSARRDHAWHTNEPLMAHFSQLACYLQYMDCGVGFGLHL